MDPLLNKDEFIGLDDCTWLYSGAESPPLKGSLQALTDYMHNRSKGPQGREYNERIEWSCKRNLAQMLGSSPENIALMSNSSEVISMVAQSMEFLPGDNVVLNTLEFPSGVLPWLSLKEKGVEIRVVQHQDWQLTVEDIMQQVDSRTKLVLSSHVSYLSGARLDYKALYSALEKTDTLLLLDITQSLGVVPVDLSYADIVVCSSYKWLLSIHGLGIMGINPRRTTDLYPKAVGWRSVSDMFAPHRFDRYTPFPDARRFELGYPSYPSISAMNYSTNRLLQIGIEQISNHVLTLGGQLIERIQSLGFAVMTPDDPDKRAGNISISTAEGGQIAEKLQERGVYVWGGDGRFRASVHLFNDSTDADRLIEQLKNWNK